MLKQPYEITADNLKLKMLVYGSPGIGKSTLALSMPNPVLIDADNGVHRIAPAHRVPTLQVSSYREVLDLLGSGELAPYETIVVDTAGKLLDYVNEHIIAENPKNGRPGGQLSVNGWGVRASTFSALTRAASTMGKHLVFVAHEKEERDGDTKTVRPDFGGGKAGGELIKDLDAVAYMEAIGRERTISFAPCEKYYAKNSARINDVLKVPDLDKGCENDFLSGIVRQIEAAAKEESGQVREYNALMGRVSEIVGSIADAATANAAGREIQKLGPIWDSPIRARAMLSEKAKNLGLRYDKSRKGFADGGQEAGAGTAGGEEVA